MATATGNISSPKGCDKDNEELNKMANGNLEQRAIGVNHATVQRQGAKSGCHFSAKRLYAFLMSSSVASRATWLSSGQCKDE